MGIKLIGIHGKARSGKDTMANFLVENHGFTKMAFADPIKWAVASAFGIPLGEVYSDEFKEMTHPTWGMTGRQILQLFGTEAMRDTFGIHFWVRRWMMDYGKLRTVSSVVVSDVREEHEAGAIRELGGLIVHLRRDSAGLGGVEGDHSSEAGIKVEERDIVITNNDTLQRLEVETSNVVYFIQKWANSFGYWNYTHKS